jgi:hypothetical protein
VTGDLHAQIIRLSRGTRIEREGAKVAERTFLYAAEAGPHRIAADHGASVDASLPEVAHRFALDTVPRPFVDLAATAAEAGFNEYLAVERKLAAVTFEGVREICAEHGPWPFWDGEPTARAIAEAIADQNPDLDRLTVITGAIEGFDEHLERLAASLEG